MTHFTYCFKHNPLDFFDKRTHWVAEIFDYKRKELLRNFVHIIKKKDGTRERTLKPEVFYEIQDGFDRFYCIVIDGKLVKITEDDIINVFEKAKRKREEYLDF